MNIQLEKIRFIKKISGFEEDWVLKSIMRLLDVNESQLEASFFDDNQINEYNSISKKKGRGKMPRVENLPKSEKKALVDEICRICEKQYRKGYQQGFTHGNDGLITEKKVSEFRLKGSLQGYRKVVHPPNFKYKENPIERVLMELDDAEILRNLFEEIDIINNINNLQTKE